MQSDDEGFVYDALSSNAGGQKIARIAPTGEVFYYLDDHLGTTQVELNSAGAVTWQGQFTPFGQEIIGGNTYVGYVPSDGTDMHFKWKGREEDSESGLGYFQARYLNSTVGRWMSPDWAAKAEPVPYANLDNPQTLNLYAYVGNNPLSRIDKDGHYECSGSKAQCGAIRDALAAVKAADANLKACPSPKLHPE